MPAKETPVVVIGAGPVGQRFVQQCLIDLPDSDILVFGRESCEPYNRVQLSDFLGRRIRREEIDSGVSLADNPRVTFQSGTEVSALDPREKTITASTGETQGYSTLVMALGSAAAIPHIPGLDKQGVYTFRDLDDVIALQARQISSRHVVILGGGLLGLEAARAMRVYGTSVSVVEHNSHLMYQQLDAAAGNMLQAHMATLNIRVFVGSGVREVLGERRVERLRLRDDSEIPCDTLIIAAGIRPNIDLARDAGLRVGRGIVVNDQLQTSDPDIHAIGDCAEHDGIVYGLVGPGYEQAAVASAHIAGRRVSYLGSVTSTTLKVAGCPVFSMGAIDSMRDVPGGIVYADTGSGLYRRIQLQNGRLTGAIGIGEWSTKCQVQKAVQQRRMVFPWQRLRFRLDGDPWASEEASVALWPASAIVCNCTGVTRGQLSRHIAEGRDSLDALREQCGACTVCGSCQPQILDLLGSDAELQPMRFWKPITLAAVLAGVLGLLYALWPGLPYQNTVQSAFAWDVLWRENRFRQISGFTLLGGGVLLAILSLRKRLSSLRWLDFSVWRVFHVVLGALLLLVLLVHSGARLGQNLNLWLMVSFLGVLLSGSLLGLTIGTEHRTPLRLNRYVQKNALWLHILFLWPLPVLLGFHIAKTYYFG